MIVQRSFAQTPPERSDGRKAAQLLAKVAVERQGVAGDVGDGTGGEVRRKECFDPFRAFCNRPPSRRDAGTPVSSIFGEPYFREGIMQASELPEYRRIRAEGRWQEATAFRDVERLRLREAGRTRQQACDESWLLMLKKFPRVSKGSVREFGFQVPCRLGRPFQDRDGAAWFSWLGGDEGPRQLVKLGDVEANAMVVWHVLKIGLEAGQATLRVSETLRIRMDDLSDGGLNAEISRLRELGWKVERPTA